MGSLVSVAGPVHFVARSCLVGRLPATGGWGRVMRRLTAEPQGVLGLVPAGWWAKPGTRVSGYRALGVPELVSACWWVGPDVRAAS